MRTTIDMPDAIYRKLEVLAQSQRLTPEEFIVRASERELDAPAASPTQSHRVALPIVQSKKPGVMDLKDFNFDDLLA